jgi:hypothetical protein
VGLRRIQRRDPEREALAGLAREAGRLDQPIGFTREVAAARQARPHAGVGGALNRTGRRPRRRHVLEEPQLAVGTQHATKLGQRNLHVLD